MSRSLTAAARQRYAPHALCVLWGSIGSRTAAERFVEAVAGRWERSALDMEQQMEAGTPAVSWSERSPVRGSPRGSRVRRAAAEEIPVNVHAEERMGPEEAAADSSPDRPRVELSEKERRARLARAPSPDFRTAMPGREESSAGSGDGSVRRAAAEESGGVVAARAGDPRVPVVAGNPQRSELAADGSDAAGAIIGPAVPAVPPTSPRRRGRIGRAIHPRGGGAGSMVDRASPGGGAVDDQVWTRAFSGGRGQLWDPVDDGDESVRRCFEQWSLERRWRDEALVEWRKWEF